MCIKCKALKKIWWLKAGRRIYERRSLIPNTYHVLGYEVSSAWKALYHQAQKHRRMR